MHYDVKEKFQTPSDDLYFSEPYRAGLELGALHCFEHLLNALPGGDGHPVMVIPGFTASDRSTSVLRNFLSALGYFPCGWKQGVNFGARKDLFEGARELLLEIQAEYGCKISLVGQSLGGIYARELAKESEGAVRQVITLGSPFNDLDGVASRVSDLYRLFNPDHLSKAQQFVKEKWELRVPPSVPTTSIYSKFDGVCHWRSCVQHGGHRQVENIEVWGSHTGMGVNAQSLFIVADRLSQRSGEWAPFKPGKYIRQ